MYDDRIVNGQQERQNGDGKESQDAGEKNMSLTAVHWLYLLPAFPPRRRKLGREARHDHLTLAFCCVSARNVFVMSKPSWSLRSRLGFRVVRNGPA